VQTGTIKTEEKCLQSILSAALSHCPQEIRASTRSVYSAIMTKAASCCLKKTEHEKRCFGVFSRSGVWKPM